MARRREAKKRKVLADPIYGEEVITKFINAMMMDGKKSAAEKQFYGALKIIETAGKKSLGDFQNPVELFKAAIENVKPIIEVKSRRVGGANYQIPIEVSTDRRQALALRWLITQARTRKAQSMMQKLAYELVEASQKKGAAVKKKDDVHKMAEANKAFAHYRW